MDHNAKAALNINNIINKNDIQQYISKIWQENWYNLTQNKLREIYRYPAKSFNNFNLTRRQRSIISRLRIGHCNLTHKYIIEKQNHPLCLCGQIITVKHIFNECQNLCDLK